MKLSVALLAAALACSWLQAAPVPAPEKLLPADTLLVLTTPDSAANRANSARSSWSQLWNSPQMKGFHDKFSSKLNSSVIQPLEKELGLKFSDFENLAQGQLTFALIQDGWNGEPDKTPGLLVLLDAKDQKDRLAARVSAIREKMAASGKQPKSEKIRDVDFFSITFSGSDIDQIIKKVFPDPNQGFESLDGAKTRSDAPANDQPVTLLIGQSDSLLIIANSKTSAEKILARQSGAAQGAALGEVTEFQSDFNSTIKGSSTYGWANAKVIMTMVQKGLAGLPADNPNIPSPMKVFASFGLAGVKSATLATKTTSAGSEFQIFLRVPESERKGLFKILNFESKDATPPAFIPANVVSFTRARFDLQKAYTGLEALLTDTVPAVGGLLKLQLENLGKDKDPNFDFRRDFLGSFGDDLITYEKETVAKTFADLASGSSLYLIGSPNPEKLAKAIRTLVPAGLGDFRERDIQGRKLFTMDLPNFGAGPQQSINMAASKEYLAVTLSTERAEEFLRGEKGKSLKESPLYLAALEAAGGAPTGMFQFSNDAAAIKPIWDILKKESNSLIEMITASPIGAQLGSADNPNVVRDWVDLSLLPSFDSVSKYFYVTVTSFKNSADGMTIRAFSPTPPGLK